MLSISLVLWQPGGTDGRFFLAGLFDREDLPGPTMENWLKNLEEWETPAKGTKRTAQLN